MKIHELANIFPEMLTFEYEALKDSIDNNGLIEPIWIYKGEIIDGRHRYKACCELGIEPKYQEWDGKGSLKGFIVSLNVNRRHLTSSQRAVIALVALPELEEKAKQAQSHGKTAPGVTLAEKIPEAFGESTQIAAKIFDTNSKYVQQAKIIMEKDPFILEDVREGRLTIPQAISELDKRERKEIDEAHPMTKEQAYGELGFAVFCDAIKKAAGGDIESQEWLADTDGGEFYCAALGLKYPIILDWLEGGCDNRTMVEMLIGLLRKQFDDFNTLAINVDKL